MIKSRECKWFNRESGTCGRRYRALYLGVMRRALTIVLLFVMTISCMHGMAVGQCLCTGGHFLVVDAEECCDDCEDEESGGDKLSSGISGSAGCGAGCFTVVSQGGSTVPLPVQKLDAPAPVALVAACVMGAGRLKPLQIKERLVSRLEGLPPPPGGVRVLLYGSRQI